MFSNRVIKQFNDCRQRAKQKQQHTTGAFQLGVKLDDVQKMRLPLTLQHDEYVKKCLLEFDLFVLEFLNITAVACTSKII